MASTSYSTLMWKYVENRIPAIDSLPRTGEGWHPLARTSLSIVDRLEVNSVTTDQLCQQGCNQAS